MPTETLVVATILSCWGILNCFFGYQVFRITVVVIAALAGAQFGYSVLSAAIPEDQVLPWVAALGLAGLTGWMSFRTYLVGVFITGAAVAYIAALRYGAGHGSPEDVRLIADVVALAFGLLALWLQKVAVSLATAWLGGFSFLLAVELFRGRIRTQTDLIQIALSPENAGQRNFILIGATVLGIVGFVVQMLSHFTPEEAPAKKSKKAA